MAQDLPPGVVDRLRAAGLDPDDVRRVIEAALAEDLDGGVDVTSAATVPADQRSVLDLVARRAGTVAGVPVAEAVFAWVAQGRVVCTGVVPDGALVAPGDAVLSAVGPTRDLLTAERTALNLLGHLSGIATHTAAWVAAVEGTGARIRDTRKTTPGLRRLDKYAVRCGGGVNHRMSLSDAALVKDNHVLAAGGVREAFDAVRRMWPGLDVEVEVDRLDQLDEVVEAGADLVLLDNFDVPMTREAVHRTAGRARLESSGGLSLDVARAYAETGVDFLAVGALTHSSPVLDIGGDLRDADGDGAADAPTSGRDD
jgi:nicotinate-nucleotide pyrophosphorylase (carboxylating)